ncbi:hypothetical protein [Legionella cincinnatiensis]|uniref:Uncharacterized protein n=1 Tax=Legionella cincinnatiensis TaxID=28085 RepID=A0A378ILM8_9GAMM|nr:hypothetical protein [Legionella cincinnatiensis]KTC82114.1 hypothetical protein Lcin_3184 [Legionella cincinnatiensis]STX35411.1 Uncharacterised protein [Legionella cincinnatiensis]
MCKLLLLRFMLLISLFASPLVSAVTNNEVTDWAQKILMDTMSISYLTTPNEEKEAEKNFSHAAWEPMNNFYFNESKIIKHYKLTLHPRPLNHPTLIKEELCFGSPCWRVNQTYNVPELHLNVAFSLLITSQKTTNKSPFIVKSLDMKVEHY